MKFRNKNTSNTLLDPYRCKMNLNNYDIGSSEFGTNSNQQWLTLSWLFSLFGEPVTFEENKPNGSMKNWNVSTYTRKEKAAALKPILPWRKN